MAATTTTLQVGTINFLSDTFTSVLDLNDGVAFRTQDVQFMQPDRLYSEAFNMRTPGVQVQAAQYGNGAIRVRLYVMGANTTAILSTIHSLFSAIENPPYWLKVQLAGGSQFTYFQVLKVAKPQIPYQAQKYLSGVALGFDITFTTAPKGITLPRQNLQNLVGNPGFESVSNAPVTVFSDPLANVNAYAVQAGGAPTTPAATTWVDVVTNANLLRFLRLGEASGTTAFDIGGLAQHGTSTSTTLGSTALVSGDTGTSYLFNGTSSKVSVPTTGLPTGNSPLAFGKGFRISAIPAATAILASYGNATPTTAHQNVVLYITSAGKLQCDVAGSTGTITSAATITTNANHLAEVRWDGTTLTLFLDGVSVGTSTPGAQAIPGSPVLMLGANTNSTGFYSGNLQEFFFYGAADTGQAARWTAFSTGASGTQANTMSLPAAGRVAFGSPAWSAIQTWQVRFRWVSGLTADFYLHFTDANNWLRCHVLQGTISLQHNIAGVTTTVATAAPVLTHEAWYWLRLTQHIPLPGEQVTLQATLLYDDFGTVGSAVTNGALGLVSSVDASSTSGRPQIGATGAALAIGGNFTGVHTLSLFGPGGWSFLALNGTATGISSGAWEQNTANTYPSGPVTSYGAGRIDLPPAGTADGRWSTWDGTGGASGAAQFAYPTSQNHVLGFSVAYKTTAGLSATSTVKLLIKEVNSSGADVATGSFNILTGTTSTSWASYSNTYTVQNAATAYVRIQLQAMDTTANSANATVWFDNVQLWDQTALGGQTSMPFCELRFPAAPAHLMVSGLVGDTLAPAFISMAAFFASWATNATATYQLGRRAIATKGMRLCAPTIGAGQVLDSTAYGGYTCVANAGPLIYSTADEVGIYHVLCREKTANPSPVNNVDVYPDVPEWQLPPGQQWPNVANYQEITRWDGVQVYPFTAQNTWTIVDAGQVILPPFAYTNQTDLTQFIGYTSTASGAWSGGSQLTANWIALLPVDGGVQSYGLKNPTGGTITNQWLYIYSDGVRGVANYSQESAALPNPAHAGGITSGNPFAPAISSGADSVMYLDPTFANLQNNINDVAGINQFLLSAADGAAAALPVAVDLSYYPAYLFPR